MLLKRGCIKNVRWSSRNTWHELPDNLRRVYLTVVKAERIRRYYGQQIPAYEGNDDDADYSSDENDFIASEGEVESDYSDSDDDNRRRRCVIESDCDEDDEEIARQPIVVIVLTED